MRTEHRVGLGFDVHRLAAGRRCVLGGIELPHERGPLGHSDGDAVLHALTDALLGAAGLDDLGTLFSDEDPRWMDAPSGELLRQAFAHVTRAGWGVANVDLVIATEGPRIAPHRAAMRAAIAGAQVGDDVFGDDPSVIELEHRAAAALGKQAALFVPSGTMANQLALLCHCQRGEEVLAGEGSHVLVYEAGAGPVLAGVTLSALPGGGLFGASDVLDAIKPDDPHFPRTRLVMLENTHNRAGGRVFPQPAVEAIAAAARQHGLALHMDGARIWNAAIASGRPASELAAPVDSVSACFSKGLGAPVGSVLAGSVALIKQARRYRKMLGGGMRQAGVLAAAALYALEHHVQRLADDHAHARLLAQRLSAGAGFVCDAARVETNIVVFEPPGRDAATFVAAAAERGVLLNAFGKHAVRAVTHLDVSRAHIEQAAERLMALGAR
jgi:threonine aldolase